MFLSNYGAQDKLFIIRSFLEIMLHHASGTSIYRYLEFTLLTFSALAFGFLITSASFPMSLQQLFAFRGRELFVRSGLHGDIPRDNGKVRR